MNTMRQIGVGADPGAEGAFGLAFVDILGAQALRNCLLSARGRKKGATTMGKLLGLGRDALMW